MRAGLAGIVCLALSACVIKPAAKRDVAWERAIADPAAVHLARPTPVQYAWHEQERIMFVCLDPCSWQGREYDNHSTKLADMKLEKLDVEQWMSAAEAWGAREILLVCKHTGGFCWWPTETTDYCVRNIPWKNGKGDLVRDVIDACRRHHLKLGVYIYSDDPKYMSGIGRGGRTDDPAKQDEWNRLLRKQWKEALSRCGPELPIEIWFDGSCIVLLDDIITNLAPHAVILQGPLTTIRWVGNEQGIASDPNWNTLKLADLKSGVATQAHSTPDGDAWAPVECDTTLYNHYWFWSEWKEKNTSKSVDALLRLYVESAGRGSVYLLNSTPNTAGLIPERDVALYRELGAKIETNFGHLVGRAAKETGSEVLVPLDKKQAVNCVDLWEEYQYGHRIRRYQVEAMVDGFWRKVAEGSAVGRRKIDLFPEVVTDRLRVKVTEHVGTPLFRQVQVHRVEKGLVKELGRMPSVTRDAIATASSVHSSPYEAKYLVDVDPGTRWGARDGDQLAWVELDLKRPRRFAAMTASELADRVRSFVIEVRSDTNQAWRTIFTGQRLGASYRADMPATTARYVRFRITKLEGPAATLWDLSLYDRQDIWEEVCRTDLASGEARTVDVDLSAQVTDPGQYEVRVEGATVTAAQPLFEGQAGEKRFLENTRTGTYWINRTQAVADGSATGIRLTAKAGKGGRIVVSVRPQSPGIPPKEL